MRIWIQKSRRDGTWAVRGEVYRGLDVHHRAFRKGVFQKDLRQAVLDVQEECRLANGQVPLRRVGHSKEGSENGD